MSFTITIPDSQSRHTAVGRNEAIYKTFTFHGIRIWNNISTKNSVDVSYASFKHSSNYLFKITQYQIEYPSNTIVMYVLVIFQWCAICMSYVVCRKYEVLYFISNSI